MNGFFASEDKDKPASDGAKLATKLHGVLRTRLKVYVPFKMKIASNQMQRLIEKYTFLKVDSLIDWISSQEELPDINTVYDFVIKFDKIQQSRQDKKVEFHPDVLEVYEQVKNLAWPNGLIASRLLPAIELSLDNYNGFLRKIEKVKFPYKDKLWRLFNYLQEYYFLKPKPFVKWWMFRLQIEVAGWSECNLSTKAMSFAVSSDRFQGWMSEQSFSWCGTHTRWNSLRLYLGV